MTIANVIAGQLIDPTWGNAVADDINTRNTGYTIAAAASQTSTNNVYDALVFAGAADDPSGFLNPADKSQFKPTVAGIYFVSFYFQVVTTSTPVSAEIRQGATLLARADMGTAFANPDGNLSALALMNGTTDFCTFETFQNSGSAQTQSGRLCCFLVAAT